MNDASLLEEAAKMKSLPPHDNVVALYGIMIQPSQYSLLVEYCPKGSLDDYL
jgi:serine/threonine protein kinase